MFFSVMVHWTGLTGEKKHEFSAVAMFHIIINIKFCFTNLKKIIVPKMQGISWYVR
jgi:hypothetical protein